MSISVVHSQPMAGMMPLLQIGNDLGLPAFVTIGGGLLTWYIAGQEIMRRRARRLAVWCKRAVDPLGGKQSVKWLTMHSFRLEVEETKAPLRSAAITGLVESWDVPMVWAWNRLHGRRDMVLMEVALRRRPIWGLELYRPGALLAGDARHRAGQEGWLDERLEEFRLAPPGDAPRELACALLAEIETERARLVRLSVRRTGTAHLSFALNVPDRAALPPPTFHDLVQRLTRATLRFATPSAPNEGQD
jgi:hypothetical protein